MKTKKLLSVILVLCMLLAALPNAVLAATVITEVNLTGDITPVANGSCKYLSIPSGANYEVLNYDGRDIHYWGDLESEGFVTSFAPTGIYGYLLALAPKDGYEFTEAVKVSVNGKALTKNADYSVFADENDVLIIEIMKGYAIDGGSHVHEADMNSYGAIDEDYHGYKCRISGCPYIFNVESFKYDHHFEGGVCTDCGYKTTYALPVITVQPQNVKKKCNQSVTLSVEATGEGLKYLWYYQVEGKEPVSLGSGAQLTTNSSFSWQSSVEYYCKVYNRAGEVYSDKATITVTHVNTSYEEAYEYGETSGGSDTIYYGATHHRETCKGCGTFQGYERHSYVDDVCKYCDHVKGSSKAPIPEIELSVPTYYYGVFKPYVYIPSEGAVVDTYQWLGRKIGETEWVDKNNSMLVKGYEYRLKITLKSIPGSEFELKYPWPPVTINGRECTPHYVVSSKTFTVDLPEPMYALHFNSNGGSGSMTKLLNVDGQFILPECTYTKDDDSFVGWRVDGKLYGVREQVNINVNGAATAYAVWESEKITSTNLEMTNLYLCKTPEDVVYTPDKSYTVESVSWCEGDTYVAENAISEKSKFDMSKNYIAKITLNGFFTAEGLDITVNSRKMTDFVRVNSRMLILYVRVINNAEIFFEEPEDGYTLPQKADFITASENYYVSTFYWAPTEGYEAANKLPADTVAVGGTPYYLYLPVKTADNYIFGNNKLRINGGEYEVYISGTTNESTTLIVRAPFIATDPRFRVIKDSTVYFTVKAPEEKSVCFVLAFHDDSGRLKKIYINEGFELSAGENSLTVLDMFNLTNSTLIKNFETYFNTAAYAKLMIWDGLSSMQPLGVVCKYK